MKFAKRFLILSIVALALVFPITAFLCGSERWAIKVAKDPQVKFLFQGNRIASHTLKDAQETSIKDLRAIPPPGSFPSTRFPAERTIWKFEATLFEYKEEKGSTGDNDYHLALRDSAGRTLIAEIPKANCLLSTPQPLRDMIKQARADVNSQLSITGGFKFTNKKVRITGPALFDFDHGQIGRSTTNGIEIHPVIKIEFLP